MEVPELVQLEILEKTNTSRVCRGLWNGTPTVLKQNFAYDSRAYACLSNEIEILTKLKDRLRQDDRIHMQILAAYKPSATLNSKMIVLEEAKMDVFNYFREVDPYGKRREKLVPVFMKRLLQVLRVLHSARIGHGDIKAENLVLREICDQFEHLAFIDFGTSCDFDPTKEAHVHADSCAHLDNQSFGTTFYRHPNLVLKKPTDIRVVDLFACGMLCFSLFTNAAPFFPHTPFAKQIELQHSFVNGTWNEILLVPQSVRDMDLFIEWKDFVFQLCSGKHITITDELLQHPFLSQTPNAATMCDKRMAE